MKNKALGQNDFEKIFTITVREINDLVKKKGIEYVEDWGDEVKEMIALIRDVFAGDLKDLHDASNPVDYAINIFCFGQNDGSWTETVKKYTEEH